LATSGAGLDILDRNFVLNLGEKQGLKSLNVNAVLVSGKQEVFIGTNEAGLYKWDGKQLFNYGPSHGFSNNSIYNLSEDEKGRIWVGTNGDGLVLLDGNKILSLNPSNGLISNVVYPIIHKNNKSYFGTYGGGLYVLEGEKLANLKESDGLANNSVLSLALDNSGNILCGTGKGLSIINFKGNSFHCQTITKKEGLAYDDFNAYAGVSSGGIPYFGAGNSLIEIGTQSIRDTLPIRANFGQIYFGSDLILNPFQEVFKSILLKNSSVRLPETVGKEVVETCVGTQEAGTSVCAARNPS
jgi:ligand-binding sensor domain-containing protein